MTLEAEKLLLDKRVLAMAEASDMEEMVSLGQELINELFHVPSSDTNASELGVTTQFIQQELFQICVNSRSFERAQYYATRLYRGLTERKTNGVNDINLNLWKTYPHIRTDTLWLDESRDNGLCEEAGDANYHGNFIPQIPEQLIQRYTKQDEWVLDPFLGSGTTCYVARALLRNTIGIELQPQLAKKVSLSLDMQAGGWTGETTQRIVCGDSTQIDYSVILENLGISSVQLVILHPPYHDIVQFSDDTRCLSNSGEVDFFLNGLSKVAKRAGDILDNGRYMSLVISDIYENGELVPLAHMAATTIKQLGYKLKGTVVKNIGNTQAKRGQKDLWRYRALKNGTFVFSHEYMFVFKKGK